jgi:hypothetical protein
MTIAMSRAPRAHDRCFHPSMVIHTDGEFTMFWMLASTARSYVHMPRPTVHHESDVQLVA